jgi:tRNA G37 N-methylase Trm5
VRESARKEGVKVKITGITKCGQYSPTTFRCCVDFRII